MASFDTFLNSFDLDKKGIQFEHFVKWFLKNDPQWKTQVEEVWLWDEYPERWGPDCGIDLVYRCKDGDICAVQAKCYDEKYSITKKDVDTFLSESSRQGIDRRLLIASTDQVGRNARQVCDAQEKPVTLYLLADFNKAAIDYPRSLSGLNNAKPKKLPKPRRHQKTAIKEVLKGFESASRGQMIMACGTGKTFTTLWIKEGLEAKTTLVLLPSLSLLSQTLWEWTFASNTPFEALCVCSDETVGRSQGIDSIVSSMQDVSFPTTSNPDDIKKFLKRDVNKVVFSTYHSSPLIAQAYTNSNLPIFDLAVADEAHRCTGETGKAFTTILDNSLIKAHKRLFTTATPRVYSANMKKKHSEMGVDIADMSNELFFGKEFHNLTFPQAIDKDLLTDYRVVIVGVDKPMIADWIDRRQLVRTDKNEATDAKTLASQIGLIKAIKDYDLKRMISFHSRVKKAELFASELHDAIDVVSELHRPEGKLYSDYVSGEMVSSKRKLKLSKLKTLHDADRGILTNARCLSEGIDVPSLDGIAFIDPRSSQVDIIQAVGRAIRKSDEKNFGTIVLPVFIEENDDAEKSIQSSNFKPIWNILNALKSHDEALSLELGQIRTNLGRQSYSGRVSASIPDKVIFDLPRTIDNSFADSLRTILIERTTESWDYCFGLLQSFTEQEGHANPETRFKTDNGFSLGSWVGRYRTLKERDELTQDKIEKLESLVGWTWRPFESQWEESFIKLEEFVEENSHARPEKRYKSPDGFNLGNWVLRQRLVKEELNQDNKQRLESLAGWTWDPIEFQWEEGFKHLQAFVEQEGHARPMGSFMSSDGYPLGRWVNSQRSRQENLTQEKIIKFESLEGWIWSVLEFQWEEGFEYLQAFVQQQGHARPALSYKSPDGYSLGSWISTQRRNKYFLLEEKKIRLESLVGWDWDPLESSWEEGFEHLQTFVNEEGHARPERRYKSPDGYTIGTWVFTQRRNKDRLSQEKKERLESFDGWVWSVNESDWEEAFKHLQAFVKDEGNARPINSYKSPDGFRLGRWASRQRTNKEELTPERKERLELLDGWTWGVIESNWEKGFEHLQAFVKDEGHARPENTYKSADGYTLGTWVVTQRSSKSILLKENKEKLDSLEGWTWDVLEFQWEERFSHLQEFVKQKGHARPVNGDKSANGSNIGRWVIRQRSNKENLTQDQKDKLESLEGWAWDVHEFLWEEGFSYLKAFFNENSHSSPIRKYKSLDGYNLGFWVERQRIAKDDMPQDRKAKLESLDGWTWDPLESQWQESFKQLEAFVKEKGHARPVSSYKSPDGFSLGAWVRTQRRNKNNLKHEKIVRLESLTGWVWSIG